MSEQIQKEKQEITLLEKATKNGGWFNYIQSSNVLLVEKDAKTGQVAIGFIDGFGARQLLLSLPMPAALILSDRLKKELSEK
jgi:hypothetical protein